MLAGPLDFLGIAPREPFENYVIEPDNELNPFNSGYGVSTNTYTIFRVPIDDFGIIGSLVFWFAVGLLTGWAYRTVAGGKLWPAFVLVWIYVETLGNGYFLRYNSLMIAYFIVAVYLLVPHLLRRRLS